MRTYPGNYGMGLAGPLQHQCAPFPQEATDYECASDAVTRDQPPALPQLVTHTVLDAHACAQRRPFFAHPPR